MAPPLRLALLGGFRLTDGRDRPVHLGLRKARGLLAYLALAPGGRASRDELAALLWGGFEQSRARHSLRQCLLLLSRALGERAPRAEPGGDLALPPGALEVDIAAFRDLLERDDPASLERAARLGEAGFLDGLDLGAEEFDRWAERVRAGLREALLAALVAWLDRAERAGDDAAAAAAARAALEAEPLRDDLARRLMSACLRDGRAAEALAAYESFRATLNRDLGVEPDVRTSGLYRDILGAGAVAAGPRTVPAARPPLESFLARMDFFAGRWPAVAGRLRGAGDDPARAGLLGLALSLDGEVAASEAAFAAGLGRFARTPGCAEILAARGAARLLRGDAAGALADLGWAGADDDRPEEPLRRATLHGLRGRALGLLGRRREAQAAYREALEGPCAAGHPLAERFAAWRDGRGDETAGPARRGGSAILYPPRR